MKPIPYGKQFIDEDDIKAVVEVLKSELLTQGGMVDEVERNFAAYVQAPFAQVVNNGTSALHLAVKALDLKSGEKVLCTPITFVASSNSVLYENGQVEFVDICPETYVLDLDKLEQKLKQSRPGEYKGLIIVSFAGQPFDGERLSHLAKTYGLWVIEDACHTLGGRYQDSSGKWHRVGSAQHVDICVFSFHPVKHITSGEGGAVTTRRRDLFERMQMLRSHGITKNTKIFKGQPHGGWDYEMQLLGHNFRLPDINCALLNSQLKKLDQFLAKRRAIAARYDDAFANVKGLTTPRSRDNVEHAYHLYVIRTSKRKELYDFLRQKNIFAQVHYRPVYQQPYYQAMQRWTSCPEAEAYYRECLSLPMYPLLSSSEQDYVIACIKEFFAGHSS